MNRFGDDWDWIRRIIEEQQRLLGPYLKMIEDEQRLERQLAAPHLRMIEDQQRLEQRLGGPYFKMIEDQQRLVEPYVKMIEDQQRLVAPIVETFRRLEAGMPPFLSVQERIAAEFRTVIAQQYDIAWVSEAVNQWQRLAETLLPGLRPESVGIDEAGDIKIAGDRASAEELEAELARLAEQMDGATTPSEYLERVAAFLGRLRPVVAWALLAIIAKVILPIMLSIAANIATPLYQTWWKDMRGLPPQDVRQVLPKLAAEVYDLRLLAECRFAVKNAIVRRGPGKSHPRLGILLPGKVVRVLATNRSWVQVEYVDDEQNSTQTGWVFNGNLGRFE